MNEITEISSAQAQAIFDSGTDGHREPLGQFIVLQPDGIITAIDNDHGCAYTEDFETMEQAKFWFENPDVDAHDVVEAMNTAMATKDDLAKSLESIVRKHLGIKTLKSQYSDTLDFHEVSVFGLYYALLAAYNLGRNHQELIP